MIHRTTAIQFDEPTTNAFDQLNQEFLLSWELFTRPFASSRKFDLPSFSCRWAGVPFRFLNALCLRSGSGSPLDVVTSLHESLSFMRSQAEPGWLVVTLDGLQDDALRALQAVIADERLEVMPATGMAGDILPLKAPAPGQLRFERIRDDATVTDFIDLNSRAYGLPIEAGRCVVGPLEYWLNHAYGYVAYEGDLPVATATGVIANDSIFLAMVATDPEHRRRGYADAVIRHALNAAHQATGIRRTSLQATDAGRPVYARLGYREVCRYQLLWPF